MFDRLHHLLELPRPWKHLHTLPAPAESYRVFTEDGLELNLRRVPGGVAGKKAHRTPVMLLHGLAANHRGFHFRERSLAEWLAFRGHDVWLPELRGHGDSRPASFDWRIDDYLHYDIPAIIETILAETGAERVHWLGHSMGGVLLMCYGILEPGAPIARGITVGSALDYKVGATGFKHLLAIRPLIERLYAVPYGTLVHLLAPSLGRNLRALEGFNVWPANIEPAMVRKLHARVFHTIPTSLLSSLATTFEDGGLRTQSDFRFVEHASRLEIPTLLVAASRDAQVSVEAVEHTQRLLGANAQMRVFGEETGTRHHYGHFDLLLGRHAPTEVWPELAAWLEAGG
ncbi:MAG: alpha/beta fold hydrolase [Persicimonas sp.]